MIAWVDISKELAIQSQHSRGLRYVVPKDGDIVGRLTVHAGTSAAAHVKMYVAGQQIWESLIGSNVSVYSIVCPFAINMLKLGYHSVVLDILPATVASTIKVSATFRLFEDISTRRSIALAPLDPDSLYTWSYPTEWL